MVLQSCLKRALISIRHMGNPKERVLGTSDLYRDQKHMGTELLGGGNESVPIMGCGGSYTIQ